MSFTVEEFRDLLRILEERPEWRAELRRLVLTDELLALPELVRALAEAQRRSEERLGQLSEEIANLRVENERRFRELTEAQLTLTRRVEDLREVVRTLGEQMYTLTTDVGELKGSNLERRYRERPFAYFSRLVRRAHTLSGDELTALLDRAVAQQQLVEEEVEEILWADLVVHGRRREDDAEAYLVVEVSWGVGPHDVERAARRAGLLAKAEMLTVPVVAGAWVTSDGRDAARAMKVWQVTNGYVIAPE